MIRREKGESMNEGRKFLLLRREVNRSNPKKIFESLQRTLAIFWIPAQNGRKRSMTRSKKKKKKKKKGQTLLREKCCLKNTGESPATREKNLCLGGFQRKHARGCEKSLVGETDLTGGNQDGKTAASKEFARTNIGHTRGARNNTVYFA